MKSVIRLIEKYQVTSFFLLTYLISWFFWLPIMKNGGEWRIIVGSFGPTFSALILAFIMQGYEGVSRIIIRIKLWRVSGFWYVFSFFSTGIVIAIALIIYIFIGKEELIYNDLSQWYLIIIAFVYVLFFSVLGEEFGWRGFALPRLQKRFNALNSSLIIGVVWGVWHMPLFLIQGNFHQFIPFWLFLLQDIALSVVITWIYNSTKGSLLLVHLFHAASNVTIGVLPVLPESQKDSILPLILTVVILVGIAVAIVFIYGPTNLSENKRIVE